VQGILYRLSLVFISHFLLSLHRKILIVFLVGYERKVFECYVAKSRDE